MTQKRREFPAFKALIAFEATVRLGSLTAAAKELGATQPAISQRIRGLEDLVGLPLFERANGGLKLKPSDDGQTLYDDLAVALNKIETSIHDLKVKAMSPRPKIVMAANFGFAHLWLLPRLAKMEACFQHVDFEICSEDKDEALMRDAHISIDFGELSDKHTVLFTETIFPVCSQAFLAKHALTDTLSAEEFKRLPLLHMDERNSKWSDWRQWQARAHFPTIQHKTNFKYNNYPLLISAVLAGQGMALGWSPLINEGLENGSLVALKPAITRSTHGYFMALKYPNNALISQVADWIKSEI